MVVQDPRESIFPTTSQRKLQWREIRTEIGDRLLVALAVQDLLLLGLGLLVGGLESQEPAIALAAVAGLEDVLLGLLLARELEGEVDDASFLKIGDLGLWRRSC